MYIGRYTDKLLEENQQLKKKIAIYESDTARYSQDTPIHNSEIHP